MSVLQKRLTSRLRAPILSLCFYTLFASSLPAANGHVETATDDQVKSVYLINFSLFVTWPKESFSGESDSLRYCVRLTEPIAPMLRKALQNQAVGGRSIELIELNDATSPQKCHIFYFSGSYPQALRNYGLHTQKPKILVITDNPEFVELGAAIGLTQTGNRIHPSINMRVVQSAKYTISAKLMSLATRIEAGEK